MKYTLFIMNHKTKTQQSKILRDQLTLKKFKENYEIIDFNEFLIEFKNRYENNGIFDISSNHIHMELNRIK